jgi:hypothetical protein
MNRIESAAEEADSHGVSTNPFVRAALQAPAVKRSSLKDEG